MTPEPTEADKAAAEEIKRSVQRMRAVDIAYCPVYPGGQKQFDKDCQTLAMAYLKDIAPERQAATELREENERLKFHNAALMDMNANDWQKLVEWLKNPDRKPSMFAFTAGIARQAAAAVEQSGILKA